LQFYWGLKIYISLEQKHSSERSYTPLGAHAASAPNAICLRLRVLIVCSISREHLAAKITKQEQSPARDQSVRISAKKTGELAAWLNFLQIFLRQRESVIRENRRNADKSETSHRLRVIKTSERVFIEKGKSFFFVPASAPINKNKRV
jgi:hypothetical protein